MTHTPEQTPEPADVRRILDLIETMPEGREHTHVPTADLRALARHIRATPTSPAPAPEPMVPKRDFDELMRQFDEVDREVRVLRTLREVVPEDAFRLLNANGSLRLPLTSVQCDDICRILERHAPAGEAVTNLQVALGQMALWLRTDGEYGASSLPGGDAEPDMIEAASRAWAAEYEWDWDAMHERDRGVSDRRGWWSRRDVRRGVQAALRAAGVAAPVVPPSTDATETLAAVDRYLAPLSGMPGGATVVECGDDLTLDVLRHLRRMAAPSPGGAEAEYTDDQALAAAREACVQAGDSFADIWDPMSDQERHEFVVAWKAILKAGAASSVSGAATTAKQDRQDAERWRKLRPALSIDGDGDGEYGTHVQWIELDDNKLPQPAGYMATVESIVDSMPLPSATTAKGGEA